MSIVEKLVKLGFGETEAMVYIELLENFGQNGTQISKKLKLPRTTVYNSLESLVRKHYIYQIPTETDSKNYNPYPPEKTMYKIKEEYKQILDSISFELEKVYHPSKFYEVHNISGENNILNKLKQLQDGAEKYCIISGKVDEHYILEKDIVKRINIEDEKELLCIVDDAKILIANLNKEFSVGIYTMNSLIVEQGKKNVKKD